MSDNTPIYTPEYESLLVDGYWEYQRYFDRFKNKPIPDEEVGKYTMSKVRQGMIEQALRRQWGLANTDLVVSKLRQDKQWKR